MKTLILGASGLVGGYLYREFAPLGEARGTAFPQSRDNFLVLDIRDKSALTGLISEYQPDLVLCPAAISNVEYCEKNPEETRQINIGGIRNVIRQVKPGKAKFIFFSSEYIFDGANGPYAEDDLARPLNEYGRQKLEIEGIIKKELSDYIIVRTTVVYGWEVEGKNFVMQMLQNLGKGSPMKVPLDQLSSPTYAADLACAVKELVKNDERGVFNIVGRQVISRYAFAKIVCSVFALSESLLLPVETAELGQLAKRPLKAGLKIDKIAKITGRILSSPEEGLKKMQEDKDAYFNFKQ